MESILKTRKIKSKKEEQMKSTKIVIILISLGFTIFSFLYTLIWGIIILTKIYKNDYPRHCDKLLSYSKALFLLQILSGLLTICITINHIYCKNSYQKLFTALIFLKSCSSFLVNIVLLIALTSVYFFNDDSKNCEPLSKTIEIYLIVEWILFGIVCLVICAIVIVAFIVKNIKKMNKIGQDEWSDDETDL